MRANFLRRALARALVLVVVVVGAVSALASSAAASGPSALSTTPWQVFVDNQVFGNPSPSDGHGNTGEYQAAPDVPSANDSGWANCGAGAPIRFSPYSGNFSMCPSSSTIGMSGGSILTDCMSHLNFTFFQSFVSIPANTNVSEFKVVMNSADDGARITLFNSAYPNGLVISGSYIFLGPSQSTSDLSPYVVAGEVNRVVVTQVDDCAVGNNLGYAAITLNGSVVHVADADLAISSVGDITTPATSADGAVVTYTPPTASDESGETPAVSCDAPSGSTFPIGTTTVTCTATDSDDTNSPVSTSFTVTVFDPTPPVITPTVTGTQGNDGWYTSDVGVSWDVSDPETAISSETGCGSQSVTADTAGTTFTCTATSAGGTSPKSVTIKRDATAPSIAFSGNAGTYTVADTVDITCTATDAMSGVASTSCPGVIDEPAWSLALGSHSVSATATDDAGNTGSKSASFTVTVDEASLCALVRQFVTNQGIANSLCAKLDAAARGQAKTKANILHAFDDEVRAQSGKALTADQAALLVNLAAAL
jgi:hypothetical protein